MEHHGIVVPMVTPVTPQGDLDEESVRRIIDHILAGGVEGVFVLGTTGESMSVPCSLRTRLVKVAVEHTANRARTYAGISSSILSESVLAAEEYLSLGVDAVVAHPPFYFPLAAAEILDYFTLLSESITGPLILYNMPSTTHISIPLEIVEALSLRPNIVGLKDSERDPERQQAAVQLAKSRPGFAFFTGVATYSAQALRWGADGAVPSSGNLVPRMCHDIYASARRGDWDRAEQAQAQIDQVAAVYQNGRSLGQSLAGLKAAMSLHALCDPTMLPPLHGLDEDERRRIERDLAALRFYQKDMA